MTGLWALWFIYLFVFLVDWRIVQPLRRSRNPNGSPGTFSFAVRAALPIFTAILLMRDGFIGVFQVPTPSMDPTVSSGDYIFVNRLSYGINNPITGDPVWRKSSPQAGDIVAFRYPREPVTTYVKRVVGLPGDVIAQRSGSLYRNGDLVAERESPVSMLLGTILVDFAPDPRDLADFRVEVPENHIFVVGDNLAQSQDSRHWGFVADYHLIGRVML